MPGATRATTLDRRLRRTRALMIAALAVRALLWALAAALAILVLGAALDVAIGLPLGLRQRMPLFAALGAIVATMPLLLRGRLRPTLAGTALWLEERLPGLQYALVTAVERPDLAPALGLHVGRTRFEPVVRRAAARALVPPAATLLVLAVALLLVPAGARARLVAPRPGDALERPRLGAVRDRLATIAVTVTPPAYTGRPAESTDDPGTVQAIVGSTVLVRGRGAAAGLAASVADVALPVRGADERWAVSLRMPARAAALRLRDGARERLLVLDPRADSTPAVTLEAPARDTVLREPRGTVALRATLADDIGLASGAFEYIVSSGSGESFTFRSGTVAARALSGRAASLAASLALDSLALEPGDVVHLSAVARDRNDVTGPGFGRSETRAIRIARAGEFDSVAIEAAPPPEAEKNVLSQRMLLIATQALERRRPRLGRDVLVRESRALADEQRRIRKAVADVVFARAGSGGGAEESSDEEGGAADAGGSARERVLEAARRASERAGAQGALDFEEDESPVVAINRPLLEAYNHMWDAARALEVAEPAQAIPPMRLALDAIQRARQAERVYLRGRPPEVIVDVARGFEYEPLRTRSIPRPGAAPSDSTRRSRA